MVSIRELNVIEIIFNMVLLCNYEENNCDGYRFWLLIMKI